MSTSHIPLRSVAHVGWTGSAEDHIRLMTVRKLAHDWEFTLTDPFDAALDLNAGRDFLMEETVYDAVILHFIFRGAGFGTPPGAGDRRGVLAVSPLASWGSWTRRLIATRAQFIVAFGGPAEVGGSYLGPLNGYSMKLEVQYQTTLYLRQP